ncbi:MAG: squalene synthase HpnC [Chthonomonadales bacterium]|nr:squalene synthase HpnC [Chthonomonadales bacterium]
MQHETSASRPPPSPYRVDRAYGLADAERYCAALARSHYENFLVATVFVPRALRQHFYNVYAYCRIADDLGDESGGADRALPLLDWWEEELRACYAGAPRHPVFVALARTNERYAIPQQPYADLLSAFRQDQTTPRYGTYAQLLDYCARSANPVGRLVLYLCGYRDAERQSLSDATCTALQLANFWQDVARDHAIGRVYLPVEDMERFGVTEATIAARHCTPSFADLVRFECERTAGLFAQGAALGEIVDRRLRLDIAMFGAGGMEVLARIRRQGYDVLSRRPVVPRRRQLALLAGRLVRGWMRR